MKKSKNELPTLLRRRLSAELRVSEHHMAMMKPSIVASGLVLSLLASSALGGQADKTIKTQLGETLIDSALPTDPITARMDSNMEIRLAGPIGVKIPAKDLPIVGTKTVGDQKLWVVQFGAKNAYAVLVNDAGRIFNLVQGGGELQPDRKVKPSDALIIPLPR